VQEDREKAPPAGDDEDGEGIFRIPDSPTKSIKVGKTVVDILVNDLNADGFVDLIVGSDTSEYRPNGVPHYGKEEGWALIYFSNKGRFKTPTQSMKLRGPSRISLADLDGDGEEDLIAKCYLTQPDQVFAYRGLGDGRFEESHFWRTNKVDNVRGILIHDFDGDGHADLFVTGHGRKLRILGGSSNGPEAEAGWTLDLNERARDAILSDVNGDGHQDVILTMSWGRACRVLRGTDAGLEKEFSGSAALKGMFHTTAAGDLNGDGFPEIAVGSLFFDRGDGRIRLYGNDGGSPTQEPIWMSDDVDALPTGLRFEDLDGDGDLDLFVWNGSYQDMDLGYHAIYENRNGALLTAPGWRAEIKGGRPRIADVDDDGLPDLVATGKGKVDLYLGSKSVRPRKADPFPPMPEFAPLTKEDLAGARAIEVEGLVLGRVTSRLRKRYGLKGGKGALVLAVPEDVAWRLGIGNLREGDLLIGVGEGRSLGLEVEKAKDPIDVLRLIVKYGQDNAAHSVGLQWRCGPKHPRCVGKVRHEDWHNMGEEAWVRIVKVLEEPAPWEPPGD
jgi:hypothetical protein